MNFRTQATAWNCTGPTRRLGADAVLPTQDNDPKNRCEPLGVPRYNHYNIRVTQIFQDDYKVAILYQYHNRWRVIWTDGRELPKLVDGGVQIGDEVREQRFFGHQVTITVEPFKDGRPYGRILQGVLADGKVLGSAAPTSTEGATSRPQL